MKNVTKTSNPLLLVSTLLAFVFSFSACDEIGTRIKHPFYVDSHNKGYHGYINCDSFQMMSKEECYIWVGKTKMLVKGDWIIVGSNK